MATTNRLGLVPSTCNDKCLSETIVATGESQKTIRDILDWQSRFIAQNVKQGTFEGIRIAFFGVFQPKVVYIQEREWYKASPHYTVRERGGEPRTIGYGAYKMKYGVANDADIGVE